MEGRSMRITCEMARIHAHLCGDGYISKIKQRRDLKDIIRYNRKKKERQMFIIGYTNFEPTLIEAFKSDIRKVHNPKLKMTLNKVKKEIKIKSKKLFELFRHLSVGNSRTWRIPSEIFNKPKLVKEWLSAYFDDEAHVEKKRFRIRVKSVNKSGLRQVKNLLTNMGIKSKIRKFTNFHMLEISGKENVMEFYSKVGFTHPRKLLPS